MATEEAIVWREAVHSCGRATKITQRYIDKGVSLYCLCEASRKSWDGFALDGEDAFEDVARDATSVVV